MDQKQVEPSVGPLEFTGERFTPECVREIWYEHMHRYALVSSVIKDKEVLDAACGEGYGSALMAETARHVTGVDISAEAIAHAGERYAGKGHLNFVEADCTALPFEDDQFDVVVSFETLEHLHEQEALVAEYRRVLKNDGVLFISSPDKAVYSDQYSHDNPYHVRELYRDEFESLLGSEFPACRLFGQKLLFHSAIWSMGSVQSVGLQQADEHSVSSTSAIQHSPMYLIAVCAAEESLLPDLGRDLWLFDDMGESVYAHYQGEIRRNMAAGGIIADRDREIEQLKAQLTELEQGSVDSVREGQDRRPWYQRLLGRK